MLDPATLEVVPEPVPFGYVSMPGLGVEPFPCTSVCDSVALTWSGLPSYEYIGETYNSMVISDDGFIVPGTEVQGGSWHINQDMPDPTELNRVIAPFWTDIDMDGTAPGNSGAGIWYGAVLSAGPRTFNVVEWEAVEKYNVPGPTYTFQIWFEAGTSDVWFVYASFDDFPSLLTVGAEDTSGTIGSSYYYDAAGTAPVVGTELTVEPVQSVAHFSFQVETGWAIGEPIVNVAEISSMKLEDPAFASAITNVEEPDMEIHVEGFCPGIMDVYGYGAAPYGRVRVYRCDWPGTATPLFLRQCGGTEVELEGQTVPADGERRRQGWIPLHPASGPPAVSSADPGHLHAQLHRQHLRAAALLRHEWLRRWGVTAGVG